MKLSLRVEGRCLLGIVRLLKEREEGEESFLLVGRERVKAEIHILLVLLLGAYSCFITFVPTQASIA